MSANLPSAGGPEPLSPQLIKLAAAANREHRKALNNASDAVQHAVKSGEILARARDLSKAGAWTELINGHFEGSLRTAQKYMRLARHVRQLQQQGPVAALSSQNEAAKAITAILRGDTPPPQNGGTKRKRRARGASQLAPLTFVEEAIELLATLEADLNGIDPAGYPVQRLIVKINGVRAGLQARFDEFLKRVARSDDGETAAESSPAAPPEALKGGLDEVA